MSKKRTIFYQEQRFGNTPSGNPKKVLTTYEVDSRGQNAHIDKVRTYQYENSSDVLKKMYGEKAKINYIKMAQPMDTYKRGKDLEKIT